MQSVLTHWGRGKMGAISQTSFSNAYSWKKKARTYIIISYEFVPKGPVNNIPALVATKPSSEPMIIILSMHICVIRPQRIKAEQWRSV